MEDLKKLLAAKEHTLILKGFDPVTAGGFTQVPNVIIREKKLSAGAKLCYAILLSYAWHRDSCFPGQETLAKDMGVTTTRSVRYLLKELKDFGYLEVVRRGLGKTNVYILNCKVKTRRK